MNALLYYATRSLMDTQGDPAHWSSFSNSEVTSDNIAALGLMARPGVFDLEKVQTLEGANATQYEEIKKILGISGAGYELHIAIYVFQLGDLEYPSSPSYEIGFIPSDASHVFKMERIGAISNTGYPWTRMEVTLSKQEVQS